MNVVYKIENSIHARPLQYWLFRHVLDKVETCWGDLVLWCILSLLAW